MKSERKTFTDPKAKGEPKSVAFELALIEVDLIGG